MKVAGILTAAFFSTAIVIVQPAATALTPPEIGEIARQITVQINGKNTGSGVIIEHQGNIYTVVTNWHVVQLKGNYTVKTPDGKQYTFNHSQVKQFPGVDLATFQFTSTANYRVAKKGNSDQVTLGTNISVAGYPQGTSDITFLRGAISSRVTNPKDGYAFVYIVAAFPGMSGGPILDEQGKLVGINGRADTNPDTNATIVYGIPLKTYLSLAPSLQTIASTPPQSADDLSSQKGVDYTRLRDLLKAGNWKDADDETYQVMLKLVGRKKGDWIRKIELLNFPCTDLRTIDRLWVKYSNGRFGFSVQKEIYLEVGGKPDGKLKAWDKFGDRVGWRVNRIWISRDSVTFDTTAPVGHLPFSVVGVFNRKEPLNNEIWRSYWKEEVGGVQEAFTRRLSLIFSRTQACEL